MAALKKKATRKTQAAALEPTPRHLWLASLGMLVAARRESKAVANRAAGKVEATIAEHVMPCAAPKPTLRAGVDGGAAGRTACAKLSGDVEAPGPDHRQAGPEAQGSARPASRQPRRAPHFRTPRDPRAAKKAVAESPVPCRCWQRPRESGAFFMRKSLATGLSPGTRGSGC
jgi:hypothetical protein